MPLNPLDPVKDWYATAYDALRDVRRVVSQAAPGLVTDRHGFFGAALEDNLARLAEALEQLNRVAVLSMGAVFERTLRDHLSAIPTAALPAGDPVRDAVREAVVEDIEFWNFSQRLVGVFEARVNTDLLGQIRQLIEYRNWVAHGHTLSEPKPLNITPGDAHARLTDFPTQAGVAAP
jgi:hypothetical protein